MLTVATLARCGQRVKGGMKRLRRNICSHFFAHGQSEWTLCTFDIPNGLLGQFL